MPRKSFLVGVLLTQASVVFFQGHHFCGFEDECKEWQQSDKTDNYNLERARGSSFHYDIGMTGPHYDMTLGPAPQFGNPANLGKFEKILVVSVLTVQHIT